MSPFVKEQVESMRQCYPDLTIDVRVIDGARPRWAYLREIILLPRAVKKGKYNLVHAHFGLTLVSTLLVRVPVVITFHGSDLLVKPTKFVSRLLAPTTSKVIVVAQRLKEILGYGEMIPCGIDVKKFILPSQYKNTPKPKIPGKLKVLFPSDPARKIKDYALFRTTCLELEKYGNEIEEVHLVNIDREHVQEIYWDCDIMLLTSLSEGSPTVIKEAIAAQLPFISVNVGDVKDWASRVNFAVVVLNRNPKTIADAATSLLTEIKARSLLNNSQCLEMIDLTTTSQQVKQVYDMALKTTP